VRLRHAVHRHALAVPCEQLLCQRDLAAHDDDADGAGAGGAARGAADAADVLARVAREVVQDDVLDVRRVDAARRPARRTQRLSTCSRIYMRLIVRRSGLRCAAGAADAFVYVCVDCRGSRDKLDMC
jgi:hypothetical protein